MILVELITIELINIYSLEIYNNNNKVKLEVIKLIILTPINE